MLGNKFLVKTLTLCVGLAIGINVHSSILYKEDFNRNPNFSSTSPGNVYWNSDQEIYHTRVQDNGTPYYGYSPSFSTISTGSDFSLTFDMNPVTTGWGTYPEFNLKRTGISTNHSDKEVSIRSHWSNRYYNKFPMVVDRQVSWSPTFSTNTWYTHEISYYADTQVLDWNVTQRDTGNVFHQNSFSNVTIGDFDQISLGHLGVKPYYGFNRWAETDFDNIILADETFNISSIKENPRDDLSNVINKLQGSQTFNAAFSTSDQSMWGTGDAIIFDKTISIGPSISKSYDDSFINDIINVNSSVDFYAQLNAGFYLNSGDVDVNWASDITTDYAVNSDGSVTLTTDYLPSSAIMTTHSPDANMEVTFDYGLDASFNASINTPVPGFDVDIVGPVDYVLQTYKDSNGYTILSSDVYFDGDGNPVDIDGNPLEYSDGGSIAIVPYTSIYGDASWNVWDGDYGSLKINQPNAPILTKTTEFNVDSGIETYIDDYGLKSKKYSNSIMEANLDLDAIAVDLIGKATGVPVPGKILGGEYGDQNLEDDWYYFNYDILNANLDATLSLFQDFEFTPELYVRIAADTGEVHSGKVGDEFLFSAKEDDSALIFNTSYYLDHPDSPSIISSITGLNGKLTLSAAIGELTLDLDVPDFAWPDGINKPYDYTLWRDSWDLADLDLDVFNDSFPIQGFNILEQNFTADTYSVNFYAVNDIISNPLPSTRLDGSEEWLVDGTAYFEHDGKMVMQTNSPTLVYTDISVPADALLFSLDYLGIDIDPNDLFSILFNDDILFSITGDMIGTDWMRTSLLDIAQYAGQDILLTISLLSPEGVHSEIWLDNLAFYNVKGEIVMKASVPNSGTLFLMLIGFFGLRLSGNPRRVLN